MSSKLHPPATRRGIVVRQALLDRLSAEMSARLVLVAAPAGWGKTSLLCDWCAASETERTAWLSVDHGDNDPVRFWAHLIAAVETVSPGIGTAALEVLAAPGVETADAVLDPVTNDFARMPVRVTLVVDDYHLITNQAIQECVEFLVEHLPPTLRRWTESRQGLVLVTGATGSGKSSTLAALIDIVNGERRDHIVTIEDPVEYLHLNRSAIVEQIEVGHDAPDFASSLRSIVRQNPDVILVGEMRDPETIATVLTAAETGHLVLSTLHTNDASQAVSRILDSFPQGNQPQIRQQLSLALLAIVAQQLVPTRDGRGRCFRPDELPRYLK